MTRLLILLFFLCYSCSPGTGITEKSVVSPIQPISQDSLYLYLTGGFQNDSLIIEYADIRIVEPDITTGPLGYAKAFTIPSKGTDKIQVSLIRPENKYTTEIIKSGNNFIEVWYCKDDVLKHYSRNEPFIHE